MPWWPAKGEESRKMPETGSLRNQLNCSPAKSRRWRLWQENGSSHVWSRNERLRQRAATSKEQQSEPANGSEPHPPCSSQRADVVVWMRSSRVLSSHGCPEAESGLGALQPLKPASGFPTMPRNTFILSHWHPPTSALVSKQDGTKKYESVIM